MADVIKEATELFSDAEADTSELRSKAIERARFARLADQWDEADRKERARAKKPCITVNKLQSTIRQIVNSARQSRPSIQISPVDGGADPHTAEVKSALIRHIERTSNADAAYDTALEHAVTFGFGFFHIYSDYEHGRTFDIGARIGRIADPMMVYWDPSTTAVDASDWNFAFIAKDLCRREFKALYGKKEFVSFGEDARLGVGDDSVRIVDFWQRTIKKRKLLEIELPDLSMLANGQAVTRNVVIYEDELEAEIAAGRIIPGMFAVLRERECDDYEVTMQTLSGADILAEDEWHGKHIPICPVWGADITIDGERHLQSAIHDAIDPQRLYNYGLSTTVEVLSQHSRAPYIAADGSIPAHMRERWETVNERSWNVLTWDANMGPRPQREMPPPVPGAAIHAALAGADDIKNVTGIHDASLGLQGNENSGRAIFARQNQGQISNYHFIDNLNRAIRYAGQCLVEIIPHLYGQRQVMRILGDDGKERVVKLQAGVEQQSFNANGEPMLFDLTTGHYDVNVKPGNGYASNREHTVAMLTELLRAAPQHIDLVADILFENMDFPGATTLAERFKKMREAMQAPQLPAPGGAMPQLPGMSGQPNMGVMPNG